MTSKGGVGKEQGGRLMLVFPGIPQPPLPTAFPSWPSPSTAAPDLAFPSLPLSSSLCSLPLCRDTKGEEGKEGRGRGGQQWRKPERREVMKGVKGKWCVEEGREEGRETAVWWPMMMMMIRIRNLPWIASLFTVRVGSVLSSETKGKRNI